MFSKLKSASEVLDNRLTFVIGGPRSGKSTFAERHVLSRAAIDFENHKRLVALTGIRPYWTAQEEARSRVAATVVRGLWLFSESLPTTDSPHVAGALKDALSKSGVSSALLPRFTETYLDEYWHGPGGQLKVDPLRWSLELLCSASELAGCQPYLILDDADFLIANGLMSEILHLCNVYRIGALATAGNLCNSRFDDDNPLAEHVRSADFVCLDFLTTDPAFRLLCGAVLREEMANTVPIVGMTAKRIAERDELLEFCLTLSGGQIGRFREVIKFLASTQEEGAEWRKPTRRELGAFCESVVAQMLQRETDPELKEMCKRWVGNLRPIIGARMEKGLRSTWFRLPVSEIDEVFGHRSSDDKKEKAFRAILSTVRCGIRTWLLQCSAEERIDAAKQTRFVPSRFQISPLAGIVGSLSLDKVMN